VIASTAFECSDDPREQPDSPFEGPDDRVTGLPLVVDRPAGCQPALLSRAPLVAILGSLASCRPGLVAGTLRGLKSGRARQRAEFETGLVQRFLNTSFDLEEIDPKEFAIRTQPGAIEQWSKWALTEADHIDPVKSARFLEGIEPED
jgi:hypothetical protein